MVWNVGSCAVRSTQVEKWDAASVSDEDLTEYFDLMDTLGRFTAGYRIATRFLANAAQRWTPGRPISILDLRCGCGDLSRALAVWGRKAKLELRIHAVDGSARLIGLARERHRPFEELTFDVRDANDPSFLQGQQYDYVVSLQAWHRDNEADAVNFLKTMDRLAKRGFLVADWLRDVRAYYWAGCIGKAWGGEFPRSQLQLGIQKGFTLEEISLIKRQAGVEPFTPVIHFGYRFSLSGERGLVLARDLSPITGLAGT